MFFNRCVLWFVGILGSYLAQEGRISDVVSGAFKVVIKLNYLPVLRN